MDDNSTNITIYDPTDDVPKKPALNAYYPLLAGELAVSILCSIVLIAIYVKIGEHRTIPGKNVICISCCLIATYVLLAVDLLMRNKISSEICVAMGVAVQMSFLATFFWTNVMSFDIMRTMRSIRLDNGHQNSKFWRYSVYAWTMTVLCVTLTVAVDHLEGVPDHYKPKFGVQKCWLNGELAFLVYFNLPVGVTLAANCLFFALTARTIIKVRNATAILAANRHKKRFRLCMKLVLIMGLVWITEFIPWLTGIYFLYAVAGMLNCMHGLYMFLIFACKRRILAQVCCCRRSEGDASKPQPRKTQSPSVETLTTSLST